MSSSVRRLGLFLLLAMLCASAMAQPAVTTEERAYSQGQLDSLLAPIALYPDPLLAQVLMAATYPLEVVQAARWSRANPELVGEEAVRAVDAESWDPSVKSLVAFPQLLQMMDERIGWTQRLGEAFLASSDAAMDAVQRLRHAAEQRGNLAPGDEVVVQRDGDDIVLEPAAPDVVYVPYYDPRTVYGDWMWPQYPPVWWAPWPGYYFTPGFAFAWTLGIPVGYSFFYGTCDWRHHHVAHRDPRPFYYHGRYPHGEWRHDPRHRQGVAYHDPALRQRYGSGAHFARPAEASRGERGRAYANASGAARGSNNGFFAPQVPGAPRAGLASPDRALAQPGSKPAMPVYRDVPPGAQPAAPRIARPAYAQPAPRGYNAQPSTVAPPYAPAQPHARAVAPDAAQFARPAPQARAPAMPSVPHVAAPAHPAPSHAQAPAQGIEAARTR